jgi:hypothetical protein
MQVPHAFQQRLSSENTPTLSDAIPSFERMVKVWKEDQIKYPETAGIVQPGIDKLEDYSERIKSIPAYVLAMSLNFTFFLFFSLTILN